MFNICFQCKKTFITKRKEQRFCSKFCKSESQKLKIVYQCTACGKQFLNNPYLKRKTNYCSLDCYHNSTRKKEARACIVCGNFFEATFTQIKKGFGKFCSRKCQHTLYPKRIVKYCLECNKKNEIPPSKQHLVKFCNKKCADDHKRDYETRLCTFCKKDFQLPTSDTHRGRGLFCSQGCWKQYHGETSIEKKIRECLEQHGIPFQQEVKMGRFHADFLITNTSIPIVIECDGEYWHSLEKARARDKRKDEFLKKKGYKVFRFSERAIQESSDKCLSNIFTFSYS